MRIATAKDKHLLCDILSEAFSKNPSVNWVVGNKPNKELRIKTLVEYSVSKGLREGTALISDNEKGAALYFLPNHSKFSFSEIWWQVILAFKVIGIFRVSEILKRESFIKKQKLQIPHIYFWYLGVQSDTRDGKASRELRDNVFQVADQKQLPILVETSEPRNIITYERMGFKTYFEWEVPAKDMTIWFMKRENPSLRGTTQSL